MKQRLFNAINIKASESKQVFDLLSVQFFIGLTNAFLNIISVSLFIYKLPVTQLPLVYLCIAVVLIVLNFLYEKLEHNLSPQQLLKIILGIALGVLLILWLGLSFGNTAGFIFALLVANTVLYMITGYAFWGLVSLLFNVRESRRVFSIVGAGDIPAKFIGYIIAPLLIPFIGLVNMVWLAIASLIVSLVLFNRVIRKKSWDNIRKKVSHVHGHEAHHGKEENLVNFFFQNKLIFAISLLSILSYNVFVLIDFTFIAQVKLKFDNISDLAIYMAVFFAVGRLIAIVFKLIFTSRVIEKLGIIASLFITPIALALFCLLFFLFDEHSNYDVFIFGMMAMITEVLRSTMQEPVFFILFQPLKEKLRLKGHIIAKGYTLPPSLIVVGLSLYFLYRWENSLSILLTVKIIAINLIVWAGVIFLIQKAYLKTLHNSIKKGTFSGEDQYRYDQTTINILLNKVNTGKELEVIYALDLLKKAAYPGLPELLFKAASTGSTEVKKYALDQLTISGSADLERLKNSLKTEPDPEVREKITDLLCRNDHAFLNELAEHMGNHDYGIRKIVIINLLNQQEFNHLLRAGNEINHLINAANPEERLLSISIISELKHLQFTKDISTLINDESVAVKRAAVLAACKLKIASLLQQILNLADEPEHRYLVIKALQQYGDRLFEDIRQLPADIVQSHTPDFVKIAANIRGEHSKHFLLQSMNDLGQQTPKIVHALWQQNFEPIQPDPQQKLLHLLHQYLKMGLHKIGDYHSIPPYKEGRDTVKNSLLNEIRSDLVVALKLCAMLYQKKSVNRILEIIELEQQQKIFNAIEMLELELPKKISKELIQLLDFILDPQEIPPQLTSIENEAFFKRIYLGDTFTYNSWTKAIIIYNAWQNQESPSLALIASADEDELDKSYIISETRTFVLNNHIKPDYADY